MLKTIVKIINTVTAVYVIYMAGSGIYKMGVEAGKNEQPQVTNEPTGDDTTGPNFKMVDGVLYEKVKKY